MRTVFISFIVLLFAVAGCKDATERKIDELMQHYQENDLFNGSVLVAKDGEIVYAKGFGYANHELDVENTPVTKFRIASVSKQFTSMLVMQMVAEGKMDLDATIREYIPDYPEPQGDIITIHHLLSHTSGFQHYAGIPNFTPDYSRQPWEHRDFVELFWDLDLQSEPGERYSYSSFGYYLLGYILERVSGKDFDQLLWERVLQPAGMYNTGLDDHITILKNRASGYRVRGDSLVNAVFRDMSTALATGDMYSTVTDMVLWDEALRNNTLLDEEYQSLIFTPNLSNYGYGWRINYVKFNENDSILTHSHGGSTNGFQCLSTRIPEDGYIVTVLANIRPMPRSEIMDNLINILYDQPVEISE